MPVCAIQQRFLFNQTAIIAEFQVLAVLLFKIGVKVNCVGNFIYWVYDPLVNDTKGMCIARNIVALLCALPIGFCWHSCHIKSSVGLEFGFLTSFKTINMA